MFVPDMANVKTEKLFIPLFTTVQFIPLIPLFVDKYTPLPPCVPAKMFVPETASVLTEPTPNPPVCSHCPKQISVINAKCKINTNVNTKDF